jgi:hypothetical protein
MSMKSPTQIQVLWTSVNLSKSKEEDYISLTDIAKYKNSEFPADLVKNRLRNKMTISFLGLWEQLNNPWFNMVEFDQFKNEAWLNSFVLSPQKRVEHTSAIWIITKSWRYWWGTYAHRDIALEFANWISIEFRLYMMKEFQRLKQQEHHALDRNVKRFLTKMNYKIISSPMSSTIRKNHMSMPMRLTYSM